MFPNFLPSHLYFSLSLFPPWIYKDWYDAIIFADLWIRSQANNHLVIFISFTKKGAFSFNVSCCSIFWDSFQWLFWAPWLQNSWWVIEDWFRGPQVAEQGHKYISCFYCQVIQALFKQRLCCWTLWNLVVMSVQLTKAKLKNVFNIC